MDFCAIPCAVMVTMVLVPSAGSTAPAISVTMAHSATNQTHMDVEQALLTNVTTVRSGVLSGTLSVVTTSTTLHAACAPLTALQA